MSDNLNERIITKVNHKGKKRRKKKCKPGFRLSANGMSCVPQSGTEKATRKRSLRKAMRTRKAKGSGYQRRVNRKRVKAMRKRKQFGLK